MHSKTDLANAINDTINQIVREKKSQTIDMETVVILCLKEFELLKLPYYSIAIDQTNNKKIIIDVPFLSSCSIAIEKPSIEDSTKYSVLYVNKVPVRKLKLTDTTNEYMKTVIHAMLDYLKRYLILQNKFLPND